MVKEIDASAIPVLPGYELSKRLGAGGYGEVWLAKAPGGLTKAVKFIYGSYHEKRAEHEFRSLERVKEVRHPFLLSLERIEIVDNRLAIVTELADGSLKERFDQCRSEGMPGIPRDELLRYLHDAADALDYLYQKHSLQHLDVKPENLLLVAGHVKVADFGLVKDVGVSQGSLVGGLTPLYSAPEVFQGTPTNRSDQYSLAVLFQELLTGVLPFDGSTAAELTLQHLHDEPNLTPLPLGDRYVLARALAKDPQQRFESCSAMVAGLSAAGSGPAADWSNSSTSDSDSFYAEPRQDSGRAGAMTMVEEEAGPSSRSCTSNSMFFETPTMRPAPPRRLPDWTAANEPFRPQPALVVGVGGARRPGAASSPAEHLEAIRRTAPAVREDAAHRQRSQDRGVGPARACSDRTSHRGNAGPASQATAGLPRSRRTTVALAQPPLAVQHSAIAPHRRHSPARTLGPGRPRPPGDPENAHGSFRGPSPGLARRNEPENGIRVSERFAARHRRIIHHRRDRKRDVAGRRVLAPRIARQT